MGTDYEGVVAAIEDVVEGPIPPRVDEEFGPGMMHIEIQKVVDRMGPPPWSTMLIEDERNRGTLIASAPGQGNHAHWHAAFDEWWVVMAGKLRWELTGGKIIHAVKGDIVWIPRGTVHHIVTEGDEMSLRFAVAMPPAVHEWQEDCENCDVTWEPRPASS
jgi:quercetin dioxygenase-like cupin family protein